MLAILGASAGTSLALASSLSALAAGPSPTATPTRPPTPSPTPAPPVRWLQALTDTPVWSGPDKGAIQFGIAQQWDYFQQLAPQTGSRIMVKVIRTGGPGWVDASAVGPSGPPPAGWPPVAPTAAPSPSATATAGPLGWVATTTDAPMYADSGKSLLLGIAPAFTPFQLLEPQNGPLLHVQDPYSQSDSYVEATLMGPVGKPDQIGAPGRWWGTVVTDGANVRSQPTTSSQPIGQLRAGQPIVVSGWVAGEEVIYDNIAWAQLGDGVYVYSDVIRPTAVPAPPPPPGSAAGATGRWIDLNLTLQTVVPYNGPTAATMMRTSTGRPGWETATGVFPILRRVANETMTSNSLLGMDAQRAHYDVKNVLWTQYFTGDGQALHDNYWKAPDTFGIPSSHGCAGLVAADAHFLWDWADVGVPVHSHY